jgi:hypothetical protein
MVVLPVPSLPADGADHRIEIIDGQIDRVHRLREALFTKVIVGIDDTPHLIEIRSIPKARDDLAVVGHPALVAFLHKVPEILPASIAARFRDGLLDLQHLPFP